MKTFTEIREGRDYDVSFIKGTGVEDMVKALFAKDKKDLYTVGKAKDGSTSLVNPNVGLSQVKDLLAKKKVKTVAFGDDISFTWKGSKITAKIGANGTMFLVK